MQLLRGETRYLDTIFRNKSGIPYLLVGPLLRPAGGVSHVQTSLFHHFETLPAVADVTVVVVGAVVGAVVISRLRQQLPAT